MPHLRGFSSILYPDSGLLSRLSKTDQSRDREARNNGQCLSVAVLGRGVVARL
jgi:hypothetical protein